MQESWRFDVDSLWPHKPSSRPSEVVEEQVALVVKAIGLAGGKGVHVPKACDDPAGH